MEIVDCPNCRTRVALKADETCPSCGAVVRAVSATSTAEPDFKEGKHRFGEFAIKTQPVSSYAEFSGEYYVPTAKSKGERLFWILFSFQGRIPRRIYWAVSVFLFLTLRLAIFVLWMIAGEEFPANVIGLLLLFIAVFWMWLAITVKRWHDRARSGWWVLIGLIPIAGPLIHFIETRCSRGTMGPNQYGPDPG